ncbi:hypothetical protein [Clostridium sp.]|uniref:hypothetical protein n=1 Tax=Clostridium sp. TaxID=1506 RepID=UPI002FC85D94
MLAPPRFVSDRFSTEYGPPGKSRLKGVSFSVTVTKVKGEPLRSTKTREVIPWFVFAIKHINM